MGCYTLSLGPMLQHELGRLKHKDVRQRRMAIRRLFEIDNPVALATFIELLDADDEWFVEKAIDAIRRWVDGSNRKVIVSLSVRKEIRLRALAAELSPRIGSEALSILSTLCVDSDISVCREAWKARLTIDSGAIPVAIESEDHIIRKMAITHSGDTEILEGMLSDPHVRVRETALNQMIEIGHSPSVVDQLLDGPLRLKAAKLRFPSLIESQNSTVISNLCVDPEPALRKVIALHLDDADWFEWAGVYEAARDSNDRLLLPRLLRSRREPRADEMRLDLLLNGDDISRARILEHLHGRNVPTSISEILSSLVEDPNPLIAQAASSLMADSKILETDI
jgi:HEAT repeat protein